MMRGLLIGVWACAVTLAAAYGGAYWRLHPGIDKDERREARQIRSIKPITVPVIADGALKGYVSAEFSIVGAPADSHGGVDPESFVMDEAFRLIYADSKTDFARMRKADLAGLTRQLTVNVNQRMGKDVVKETLVKSFTFISRDDLPR
ncbi:flagellar basal body-associated protein FliL [Methylocystis sp. S23]|jgi:hypothetical protein